ncbi:hypothetical protein [Nonomuraea sp. JJY05]|uniref:hypothetical protein n=1 Tax=Nonomuraea sp. JJY05 TaxID=3350255 RepID=UPI00373EED05
MPEGPVLSRFATLRRKGEALVVGSPPAWGDLYVYEPGLVADVVRPGDDVLPDLGLAGQARVPGAEDRELRLRKRTPYEPGGADGGAPRWEQDLAELIAELPDERHAFVASLLTTLRERELVEDAGERGVLALAPGTTCSLPADAERCKHRWQARRCSSAYGTGTERGLPS